MKSWNTYMIQRKSPARKTQQIICYMSAPQVSEIYIGSRITNIGSRSTNMYVPIRIKTERERRGRHVVVTKAHKGSHGCKIIQYIYDTKENSERERHNSHR